MQYKSYRRIIDLARDAQYLINYEGKTFAECLLQRFNCRTLEEVYNEVSKEEIDFAEAWINKGLSVDFFINRMKSDFSNLSLEELHSTIEDYLKHPGSYADLCISIPDRKLILDHIKGLSERNIKELLKNFFLEDLFAYINNDGENKDEVLKRIGDAYHNAITAEDKKNEEYFISNLDNDLDRAKFLLYGGDIELMPYVQNHFYRNQITKLRKGSKYNFRLQDLLDEIDVYDEYYKKALEITDERSRAEYIASINNNEMKEALLFELIKERENRDVIIDSFTREVDPNIESLDNLAQTMIKEFFEDALGADYTDKMREIVNIVCNKTSVCFKELAENDNGIADYVLKTNSISTRHINSINRNLGFLIHEYAHLLSNFYFSYTGDGPEKTIEEGMADLFGDLVVNHYLDKHKNVVLDGRRVRIDKPYQTYSGYHYENAWARTILAGLEPSGNDLKAVGAYYLESKKKYATMVFGENGEKNKRHTKFGETLIDADIKELYDLPNLDFSHINKDSIYYNRNYILPLYRIQNRIGEGYDVISGNSNSHDASLAANYYFKGKNFYEVPKDELAEFMELLEAQKIPGEDYGLIGNIKSYRYGLIKSIRYGDISDFPFELIERMPIIMGNTLVPDPLIDKILNLCFDEEIEKIRNGQSPEETKRKLDIVTQELQGFFEKDAESGMYINDYINDFCYEASEALREYGDHDGDDSGKKLDEAQQMKETVQQSQQSATQETPNGSKESKEWVITPEDVKRRVVGNKAKNGDKKGDGPDLACDEK